MVIVAAEFPIAWLASAIGLGAALGVGWASFRAKGRSELVNLMEQRIRIQDGEIDRLEADKAVLAAQNELLTNGFVDRIVVAVERAVRDRGRSGGRTP